MDTCYPYYELYLRCFPEFPVTYRTFLQTLRPERGQIFAQWDRGALAGYALAHGSSMAMLCVEESHRRQGMGNWLMAQAEAAACRQSEPRMSLGQGAHYLFQGVPEGPAVDFFRERGYRAQWSSVNMSLSLGGFSLEKLDIPPGPEGLSYRFAEAGDREALLAAVKEAKSTWTSIFETCQDPVLLAVLEGEIAGFLILDPEGGHFSAPPRQRVGSIGCVGVVPDRREQGVGLRMVAHGTDWLKSQGSTQAELRYTWLESWYGRLGFSTTCRQWMAEKNL